MADVVLWSSLLALVTEQNIVSQYLSSKHSILKWFNNLKDLKPVKVRFIIRESSLCFNFQECVSIYGVSFGRNLSLFGAKNKALKYLNLSLKLVRILQLQLVIWKT